MGCGITDDLAQRALVLATRTCFGLLGRTPLAEDVAHDVVVKVLEGYRRLRRADRFDAWVHRIAVREALRQAKASRARERSEVVLQAADAHYPSFVATDDEQGHVADAALARLSDHERTVFVLRYVHDLSDGQVAAVLRRRPGSIRSTVSRARARLRADPELRELLLKGKLDTENGDDDEAGHRFGT